MSARRGFGAAFPEALRYGDGALRVPAFPFRLQAIDGPRLERASRSPAEIGDALGRPIAAPPLRELFRGARRVLVVVPDGTRTAATALFLPALVEAIEAAGRPKISFAVASGIHRPPTEEEIRGILGPDLAGRFAVLRHDPDDRASLADLGRTRAGTPVRVLEAVRRHDRIVLAGGAGFHYYAGFSGGRKALVPGLSSRETVTRNHLRALRPDGSRHPKARAGRLDGNPVHRDMVEGAALVGPDLVVNSVLGDGGGIERLFVGHWRRAHEAACRHLLATRRVRVAPRDLVVASAGGAPADVNLIQSHKAFESGFGALRPGGVFVLVARCPEGAGHGDFLPFLDLPDERAMAAELAAEFRVYRQTALAWFRKASCCRLVLVSDLPADTVRRLRAEPAGDLAEALAIARRHLSEGTEGWVLAAAGRLLVEPDVPLRA